MEKFYTPHTRLKVLLKTVFPTTVIVVILGGLILFLLIPVFEAYLLQSKKTMVQEMTQLGWSLLADYDQRVKTGELTLADAQSRAINRFRQLRYGPNNSDYFWINDLEPKLIMHPYRSDLEGQDVADFRDATGTRSLLMEFNNAVSENGEGLVEYLWQWREDPNRIETKLSSVKLFEPWGWIIGTGIYLDDVDEALSTTKRTTYWVMAGLLIIIAAWSILIIWRTEQAELKRQLAISELQKSEAQLSTLFDSAFHFIGLLDLQGKVIKVNQTALDFIDKSITVVQDAFLWDTEWFLPCSQTQKIVQESVTTCAAGELVRLELLNFGSEKQKIIMDTSFKPIYSPSEQVQFILVEGRDITHRKNSEEKITKQLQQLNILHQIDSAITTGSSLTEICSVLFDQILRLYHFDALSLWIYESETDTLTNILEQGTRKTCKGTLLKPGEGFVGKVVQERKVLYATDRDWYAEPDMAFLIEEDFKDFAGFPLIAHGEVGGVLQIFHRSVIKISSEDWHFLNVIAGQAAIAVDNAILLTNLKHTNHELNTAYDRTLEGWAKALELRDEETEGHSRRVTETTIQLAKLMDVFEDDLVHIRRGAILHDIGKMGISDGILLKNGTLSPDEWKKMKYHPVYAYQLLAPIPYLRQSLDIPYCHHEWWNGEGYPRGLSGEEIPLAARIFAVIDVWDALSHDRPYRKAWDAEKVKEYILNLSGKQFDPRVVEKFMELIK